MKTSSYGQVLALPAVRRVLLFGILMRIPLWAGGVALTLHIVSTLDRGYGAAGLLVGAQTVAVAISGPWRGRRLDRAGLRTAVAPSLVVLAICWSVAPWVGYLPLLVLATLAGLFAVPNFSIVRMVLMNAVEEGQRKSALALDAVAIEVSFMIGPVLGVLAATYADTRIALFACEMLSTAGAFALWWWNPPLSRGDSDDDGAHAPVREWLSGRVVLILSCSAVATMVLTGGDLGAVAALREMGEPTSIGWVLAAWGAGSAIGGLVYGAMKVHPSALVLLLLLSVTSIPVSLAGERFGFAALLFVTGLFCAPTLTATVDDLSRAVPERVRGEAMGWHGSALTGGSAIGSPLIGLAIDHTGWGGAFVGPGVAGLLLALAGMAALGVRRPRPVPGAISDVDAQSAEDLARRLAAVEGVEVQARGAAGE